MQSIPLMNHTSQQAPRSCACGIAIIVAVIIATGNPAAAFKWHECPAPPIPAYPSAEGATASPFIHPGHPLTILLNEAEVTASGGFSLDPMGNEISITFQSLFGPPVQLAPRYVSTGSHAALTFDFPDTAVEVGKSLAGPVEIAVVANGQTVAHILPQDFVALPPNNDVTDIVLGTNPDQVVLGAIAADGDLWIPTHFQGDPMTMPMCPGNFIVPLPIYVGGVSVIGGVVPANFTPLDHLRSLDGYLGDIEINGYSFYGMLVPQTIDLVHVAGTLGVSICRLNDAVDLVLRIHGAQSWALPQASPFRNVAWHSTPVPLHITSAPLRPGKDNRSAEAADDEAPTTTVDSFGGICPSHGHD